MILREQNPASLKGGREEAWLKGFILIAVLVNFSGLFIPLMDPDAGVYGSVSKYMLLRNDYTGLYFQGSDWLDKPHFPFWVTALFFKIFGVHTWSYKLPGILFALLGAWYTYRFAKQQYSKTIALWAAFILLTAEHFIISNSDVRAEPFLTGLIMASVYHFSNSFSKNISGHLILACLFAGCAVMTKGIFTIAPIGGAVAGELIIRKNWKELFHWRWLVAGALLVIFISPELYSLWQQFDQHPEKIVFGKNNVSGIRFFLWDSQFGRFANSGPIKGKGDPSFFLHTLLWAFLPWSLLMYGSLITRFKKGNKTEWYTLCGSLVTIVLFSLSKFQLPYYTNIIFPFLAILTAQFLAGLGEKGQKNTVIIQNIISIILVAGTTALHFLYLPEVSFIWLLLPIVLLIAAILLPRKLGSKIWVACSRAGLITLAVNFYINSCFYPDLMQYQSGDMAAKYINKELPGEPVTRMGIYSPGLEFYLKDRMFIADKDTIKSAVASHPGLWFVSEDMLPLMQEQGIRYQIIKEFSEFHVTMLTLKFINKKTREKALKKTFIVRVS